MNGAAESEGTYSLSRPLPARFCFCPITEPKLLLHKELTASALPHPVDCVRLRSDLPSQPHSVTPLVTALFLTLLCLQLHWILTGSSPLPPFSVSHQHLLIFLPLDHWRSSGLRILSPLLSFLVLPKQSHSCACICKDAQTSSEFQNYASNCLFDSSTWQSHRHLKPNGCKTTPASLFFQIS